MLRSFAVCSGLEGFTFVGYRSHAVPRSQARKSCKHESCMEWKAKQRQLLSWIHGQSCHTALFFSNPGFSAVTTFPKCHGSRSALTSQSLVFSMQDGLPTIREDTDESIC